MRINEENYVDLAEKSIKELANQKDMKGRSIPIVTTSKIRNLLAMSADIYNEVVNSKDDKLSNDIIGRINYMKLRFYYEAGREKSVKDFLEKTEVLKIIDEIKGSRKNYILFSHYLEALVAFRKFYGGNDD
jgi:CRISPR-associated protein Csm2